MSHFVSDMSDEVFPPLCFKPQLNTQGHLITVATLCNLISILCHIDLCFYFCLTYVNEPRYWYQHHADISSGNTNPQIELCFTLKQHGHC